MYDLMMHHEDAKAIVKELGFDGFVKKLDYKFGYNIYGCSTYWYDNPKFICKLKGSKGDIIVGWIGIHD